MAGDDRIGLGVRFGRSLREEKGAAVAAAPAIESAGALRVRAGLSAHLYDRCGRPQRECALTGALRLAALAPTEAGPTVLMSSFHQVPLGP